MAYISQDPNTNQESNTTNVLAPTATPTPQTSQPAPESATISTSAPSGGYVSTGNPYGKYATPGQPTAPAGTSASSRKTSIGPSSGLQTNVQTYAQKNVASSQGLGSAVAGKLQNTSDIAKQNLAKVETKYQQGMEAGSLANRDTALQEAQTGFTEAATAAGPERTFKSNEASMYMPTKTAEGAYSAEDQALVDANKARVTYGDNSTKEFATQAEAQAEITDYNKANPGYYTYGEEAPGTVAKDRLSEILNAEYKGPTQLSDIAGYSDAYNKFQDVSSLQDQALKGRSKEELLNRTFAAPTGEYTKGSRLLDELLLGQGQAASTLKSTAEKLGSTPTGMVQDEFKGRGKEARAQAVQRATEIGSIKEEARKALTETAAGRSEEVNTRINDVIKDWDKYPDYFKERFKGELEKHNVSSQKKQEYSALEAQYGSPEQLQAKKQSYDANYGKLKEVDADQLMSNAKIIDNYNSQKNMEGSSDRRTAASAKSLLNDYNFISQYERAKSYVDSVKPLISENLLYTPTDWNSLTPSGVVAVPSEVDIAQNVINTKNDMAKTEQGLAALQPLQEFRNYDPNALDVGLSQLEAEALGVQGGEGLYNILKEQGVEGLIKTAAYDKNKLVSTDEQSQLARLQSIAEMAKDYGVSGSGINVVNPYGDRDLAGQQTALSALDMENFKRQLQGAEKGFRTDAAASNISGTGTGSGSSRGLFGKKSASATTSLQQNFGDLLAQNNATRNMYSDAGVDKDLLKQIIGRSKAEETFNMGNVDPGAIGGSLEAMGGISDTLQGMLSNTPLGETGSNLALLSNPVTAPLALANMFGSALGGSRAAAQGEANTNAYNAAIANLQANIKNKINTSGLKNQLSVGKNTQQDMELFKLLGLLDTTNL